MEVLNRVNVLVALNTQVTTMAGSGDLTKVQETNMKIRKEKGLKGKGDKMGGGIAGLHPQPGNWPNPPIN